MAGSTRDPYAALYQGDTTAPYDVAPESEPDAQSLYQELTNRRMTVVDALFWFGLGVLCCLIIQQIG